MHVVPSVLIRHSCSLLMPCSRDPHQIPVLFTQGTIAWLSDSITGPLQHAAISQLGKFWLLHVRASRRALALLLLSALLMPAVSLAA